MQTVGTLRERQGDDVSEASRRSAAEPGINLSKASGQQARPDEFLPVTLLAPLLPQTLRSPEANTMQLYQTFIDLYLPKLYSDAALRAILTAAPASPALSSGIRSVSLFLVHRESDDPRLFHAAHPQYSNALRDTRRELSRPGQNKSAIVGMSHMLLLCELFNDLSLREGTAGVYHAQWMVAYIESYRTDNPTLEIQRLLVSGIRWFATWGVLLARKAIPGFIMGPRNPQEQALDSILIRIGDLTIATAGMLEESDSLCKESDLPVSRILAVLDGIIRLEGKLHEWLSRYYKSLPMSGALYWTEPASNSSYHQTRPGTCHFFKHIYAFPNLTTASGHLSYWMCQLQLVEARISIVKTFFTEIEDIMDTGLSDLVRLRNISDGYADSICMSMPFMGRPANGWAGRIVAIRPLNLLIMHYKQRREWQKLSWCAQCATDLKLRASKSVSVQKPLIRAEPRA